MLWRAKSYLRNGWVWFLFATGALRWAKRRLARRGAIVVLTLHRVLDDHEFEASSSLNGILMKQRTFDDLLAHIKRECELVDLGDGTPSWTPSFLPRIALTFDDGWLDNFRYALPLAVRHRVNFTMFVCAGMPGRRFPFWPEQVKRSLRVSTAREYAKTLFPELTDYSTEALYERVVENLKRFSPETRHECVETLKRIAAAPGEDMEETEPCNQLVTWDQIARLHRNEIRIGSHTMNHPILTQLQPGQVECELRGSRQEIEAQLNSPCVSIAYPNGNHSPEIVRIAKEAGYSLGFTTKAGAWEPSHDPLQIPRINIHEQKLVGPGGRFSRAMFEYSVFWQAGSSPASSS